MAVVAGGTAARPAAPVLGKARPRAERAPRAHVKWENSRAGLLLARVANRPCRRQCRVSRVACILGLRSMKRLGEWSV